MLFRSRVHVLQFDFLVGAVGDPVDSWVMGNLSGVDRWLKINLVPSLFGAINQTIFLNTDHDDLPWEREAALLSGYR